jgi:hypothetical protein
MTPACWRAVLDVGLLDPYHTESRVQDWNLTFEKEIMDNTIVRVAYVGNHGDHQQQEVHYNDSTPAYVWLQTTKTPVPGGRVRRRGHAAVRQTGYGNITLYTNSGYGNFNGAQFELERRFSKGFSYQIFWNVGNTYLLNRDTDDTQPTTRCPASTPSSPEPYPRLRCAKPFLELQAG